MFEQCVEFENLFVVSSFFANDCNECFEIEFQKIQNFDDIIFLSNNVKLSDFLRYKDNLSYKLNDVFAIVKMC